MIVAAILLPAVGVPGRQGRQWLVLAAATSVGVILAMMHVVRTGSLPWSYMSDVVDTSFGLALPALLTGLVGLPLARLVGRLPQQGVVPSLNPRAVEQRDEADEPRER